MAVSRTIAWVDSESLVHALDRATVRRPFLLVPGQVADQVSWARVIRHARCAEGSLDPDQWFPVSAEAGKARRRRPQRSPSALNAWYEPRAWRSRCGTGISASTVSGAAWSQPNARHCAADACELDGKAHVKLSQMARMQMWPQLARG
jgi:hypothetical protein